MENLLEIKNLHATIDGKEILKGINLTVKAGEVHAIMGPNGSGKSTLSNVLVGHPAYTVTEGEIIYKGKNLLELSPEDRSHEGLFLSFQYPVEIPGVSITNFMRAAINAKREYLGQEPMNATEFLKMMREKRAMVNLDSKLANRSVNEGFSGGEKKRNEIFQMAMLEPTLSILDETDAGLDIRAMEKQIVPAKESAIFKTGVHISLPHGMAGVLVSKSGLNVKHDITSTGLIDEGYTGEIIVKLYNHGGYDYEVSAGDKISQLVIVPVLYAGLNPVEDLNQESERGSEGFGSTGK